MSLINISHSDKNKIDLSYMDKIMKRFRRRCDIIEMSRLIDQYVKNWRPRYVDNENGIFNVGFPLLDIQQQSMIIQPIRMISFFTQYIWCPSPRPEEDLDLIMGQTHCDIDEARYAYKKHDSDYVEAIIFLESDEYMQEKREILGNPDVSDSEINTMYKYRVDGPLYREHLELIE